MQSIFNMISILNNNEWDYYNKRGTNGLDIDISIPFVDDNQNGHLEFIENYFKIGGKGDIFETFNITDTFDRPAHTNSVFFLGCLFYKHLQLKNKMQISRFGEGDHFFFVWYMTVLAHDLSYTYESDFSNYKDSINDNINNLKQELRITNNDLLDLMENVIQDENIGNIEILLKSVKNYYRYCYNERNKIDHGIVAGLKLYDSLEKNRKKKDQGSEHDKGGLYWGSKLTELYMMSSLGVLLHNIWAPSEETIHLYKKYEMENLKEAFPLIFKDFPFLFLLGVVDTLEPIKLYKGCNPHYVLENILIGFENKNKVILRNDEGSNLDFTLLKEAAIGLAGWLDVTVCIDDNSVTISIKGI